MPEQFSLYVIIGIAAVILVLFFFASYVKAPPSYAYIISGLSREPRVLIGSGGFRIPFFERLDRVYLGQITVDIKTEESVPTTDFINVDVDAVAKIRVTPNAEGTRLAAKNFLNMTPMMIAEQLQDSLQGNRPTLVKHRPRWLFRPGDAEGTTRHGQIGYRNHFVQHTERYR